MPKQTLANMIFAAVKNYRLYLKVNNKKINSNREDNIKDLFKLCNIWVDEDVLYNKIKYYLKEKFKHKRIAWSFYIVQVDHSEFRLMLNSALHKWEKQQKSLNVNSTLLQQNRSLIARIDNMEKNFAVMQQELCNKEKLIKDLLLEIKFLKSDDSLLKINYNLHKEVCMLQQKLLCYEQGDVKPTSSLNYDSKKICS